MIEAVKLWNEPNNKSHWDPEIDPDWSRFAELVRLAGRAVAEAAPGLTRVLGGLSPIDPHFVRHLEGLGALDAVDVVAVHGFPLDWNLWQIGEWPAKLDEIRAVTDKPLWVTEVGVSSIGAEEVQAWGVRRTAELLVGRVPRIHWYSLYDRADWCRPGAAAWYDRMLDALGDLDVTLTFCFTPAHKGIAPHHTSAPREPSEFADFCGEMVTRYASHVAAQQPRV